MALEVDRRAACCLDVQPTSVTLEGYEVFMAQVLIAAGRPLKAASLQELLVSQGEKDLARRVQVAARTRHQAAHPIAGLALEVTIAIRSRVGASLLVDDTPSVVGLDANDWYVDEESVTRCADAVVGTACKSFDLAGQVVEPDLVVFDFAVPCATSLCNG